MADAKISALPSATTPLVGTEVLPIVQSGATVKVASVDITGGVPVGKGAGAVTSNTVVGINALTSNVSGTDITAVGNGALQLNTGVRNTAVGANSLTSNTSGIYNSAVGSFALSSVVDGTRNTAIGYAAGNSLNNGSGGIFIGYLAQPQGISDNNTIVIGDGATGNGTNTTTIGNASTTATYLPNGNLVFGTAGKGIDFSADGQAAGMTSELLDDYEEGTWTPTFIGSGGNPTVTFTTQLGSYTKVGRLVFIKLDILVNSTSGGSGNLSVSGLPFVNSAINSGLSNAFVFNFVVSPLNYHVVSGSDSIALFQDTITNTPSTVADLQASAFLRISGCYSV